MTRIIALSDSHGRHNEVVVPDGDVLVHAGDYASPKAGMDHHDASRFLAWFEAQPHEHKVFISGNHDGVSEAKPDLFAGLVAEHAPSCVYLRDSGATIAGLRFWGSPVTPTFYDWYWNRDRGAAIQAHWDLIPSDTEVLITHGPVAGIHDRASRHGFPGAFEDVGCVNLRDTITARLTDLRLHASGHVHPHGGKTTVRPGAPHACIYVNASVVNERYQYTHAPVQIDL